MGVAGHHKLKQLTHVKGVVQTVILADVESQ